MKKKNIKTSINPKLSKIKNKKKLCSWLIRQYFDESKHSDASWYDPNINEQNVLEYVSNASNNFPLTPRKILDMFRCMELFKTDPAVFKTPEIKRASAPLKTQSKPNKKLQYQKGEVLLSDIGKELGGLSNTMITRLSDSGVQKFRTLTNNTMISDMDSKQFNKMNEFIVDCRIYAALGYADALKKSKLSNIKDIFANLKSAKLITANDIKQVDDSEKQEILALQKLDQGDIVQALLKDISKDNNIFKSYQVAVSRKAFPRKSKKQQLTIQKDKGKNVFSWL